jgi:hypothetical protein
MQKQEQVCGQIRYGKQLPLQRIAGVLRNKVRCTTTNTSYTSCSYTSLAYTFAENPYTASHPDHMQNTRRMFVRRLLVGDPREVQS